MAKSASAEKKPLELESGEQNKMKLTYRFRLRDTCSSELTRQANAVNFVWNYVNETQQQAVKRGRKWLSWHDLQKLTSGSSKELGLHAHTIQQICQQYDRSRVSKNKPWLRWRVSNKKSSKRSLGWVPFNKGHVEYKNDGFVFRGKRYKAWVSRKIENGQKFGAGCFSQDSQGNWYINLGVEIEPTNTSGMGVVGIDLGLKEIATLSTGEKLENPRWYRQLQERIARGQRANKKRNVRKLHAKAKRMRHDYLHKFSNKLVRENEAIFVGNIDVSGLSKTKMAKSVFDAGWGQLKRQLDYKAIRHRVFFKEVNESYSTQTCFDCGSISGPKGQAGLGIRHWVCGACGSVHDRDTNAAKNIARVGLDSLVEGAASCGAVKDEDILLA